jgi:hypothetical protein
VAGLVGGEVRAAKIRTGKKLYPGQPSPTGLYAVCKTSGWPLRVTLFRELADLWRHESRDVRECFINLEG